MFTRDYRLGKLILMTLMAASFLGAGSTLAEESAYPVEVYTHDFYDGITVTSMRLSDGDFRAILATPDPSTESSDGKKVRARYYLKIADQRGELQIMDSVQAIDKTKVFEYSNGNYQEPLPNLLNRHTVASIALTTLWVWEDHGPGAAEKALIVTEKNTAPGGTCTPIPNGCSGWGVPQTCAGTSLVPICDEHDRCYQCGAICDGTTRAECDSIFQATIYNETGSWLCAEIYYLGVRALGWLFYQDPNQRPNMGPDVYSLGIGLSACGGQYSHLCTHYVM